MLLSLNYYKSDLKMYGIFLLTVFFLIGQIVDFSPFKIYFLCEVCRQTVYRARLITLNIKFRFFWSKKRGMAFCLRYITGNKNICQTFSSLSNQFVFIFLSFLDFLQRQNFLCFILHIFMTMLFMSAWLVTRQKLMMMSDNFCFICCCRCLHLMS